MDIDEQIKVGEFLFKIGFNREEICEALELITGNYEIHKGMKKALKAHAF